MYNFKIVLLGLFLSLNPNYIRSSLISGSVLLWVLLIQIYVGVLLGIVYFLVFDIGLAGIIFFWWETSNGSFLARLHSELGNIVFFILYSHILIKYWNSTPCAELDQSWISGLVILIFMYVVGITGAIMPCSILSEVTATVIGYAINSLSFINFDFLGSFMIPGLGLTDDTLFRVFCIHAIFPFLIMLAILDHTGFLHVTEYTDEDEMDVLFFSRFEYWDDFIWLEIFLWFELIFFFSLLRFFIDFMWPRYMTVAYAYANFEFWPLQEDIDFVLAIPHWYLRPLMASLVVIPHHYIGFFYVIFFFLIIIISPWFSSSIKISSPSYINDNLRIRCPSDFFNLSFILFSVFFFCLTFATLVIPTGRYFVSLGSCEFLVYSFWFFFNYIILSRIVSFYFRLNIFYMTMNY